jgi:hypothetical protein
VATMSPLSWTSARQRPDEGARLHLPMWLL